MKKLLIVLAVLALGAGMATAKLQVVPPATATDEISSRTPGFPTTEIFYDNIESGNQGWTHGDYTATYVPQFHVDSYMAYTRGNSWWCGNFTSGPGGAPDPDGGYGNGWIDFLKVPSTVVSGYPIVDFAYRADSEVAYDFSFVQAESGGVYVDLNKGWAGLIPWTQTTGFYLGNKDNPAIVRFSFKSDGAWSDAGGNNTVGGGFACDNIRLYDYSTGTVFFYDDVESGGLCIPAGPATAGDYWHIDQTCAAASMSHVWSVAYPDTSFVQPNIQNWLMSPLVDVSFAETCSLSYRRQVACQTDDNDFWTEELYVDGSWYDCGGWWGDICDANGAIYICYPSPIQGKKTWILDALMPATQVGFRWTFYTTDDGTGPDLCNHAGYYLDDFRVFGYCPPDAVAPTTWSKVKSLYR
jgi:hypothetical protein